MQYKTKVAVCSQIHTKHINTQCGQNVELLNVTLAGHLVTTGLYMCAGSDCSGYTVFRLHTAMTLAAVWRPMAMVRRHPVTVLCQCFGVGFLVDIVTLGKTFYFLSFMSPTPAVHILNTHILSKQNTKFKINCCSESSVVTYKTAVCRNR